jgi:4-amino-4-deoxy-L-arabinose transferase-like glycosyltransferase
MKRLENWLHQLREKFDIYLSVIVILAIFLRTFQTGLRHFHLDDSFLYNSILIARYGRWTWVSDAFIGWEGSRLPITYHSPLNDYFLAIPYLFSPDMRDIRAFVGFLAGFAVIIVYLYTRRYFGRLTALVTCLLLAVNPAVIAHSRWTRIPYLAHFFLALWVYTGLVGYYENKPRAQIAHWILLALIVQFQPANSLLVLATLVLVILNIIHFQAYGSLLKTTAMGMFIGGLTFIPWLIGIPHMPERILSVSDSQLSVGRIMSVYQELLGSDTYWFQRASSHEVIWWPPNEINIIFRDTLPYLAIVVSVILFIYTLYRRNWQMLPVGFLAFSTLYLPLLGYTISPNFLREVYFMGIIYTAFPIMGIALIWIAQQHWVLKVAVGMFIGIMVVVSLWYTALDFRWMAVDSWLEPISRAPLTKVIDVLDELHDENPAGEIIVLVGNIEDRYSNSGIQTRFWQVIGEPYRLTVIDRLQNFGIPLSANHPTTLLSVKGEHSINLFEAWGDMEYLGQMEDSSYAFNALVINSQSLLDSLSHVPENGYQFSNGAEVQGVINNPSATDPMQWSGFLIWQPVTTNPNQQYQFSLRVLDLAGNRYGQTDFPSLIPSHWQVDTIAVNPFVVALSSPIPQNMSLRIQLLMYTFPDIANVAVVDRAGSVVGEWLYLD